MHQEIRALIQNRTWFLFIRQLDISNACLHGDLTELFYMAQPQGFKHPQFPHYVCQLQKSLYSLKQAPRECFHKLTTYFIKLGFSGSKIDTSLFFHSVIEIYALIYVDDILLLSPHMNAIQSLIRSLNSQFSVKDLGQARHFMGVEFLPHPSGYVLTQSTYTLSLLKRAHMDSCKPLPTPSPTITCPDISFAVNSACRAIDADWAGSSDDRGSTGGFLIYIGPNLISWSSKKQPTVARSSTEAEYKAVANAAAELIWLRSLLRELRIVTSPPTIWCDNIGAIYMAANPVFHKRMKHIEVDFHFVREQVSSQ
ncbi:unnamed protein product [Spirodela intermedia]|uniref:Reverse transcriptase Ty1/copia-type domain-containing protein n=1 Tax=Spirodela intermedia TaxID=51605 RepID=A0A7I8KXP5_SPIIN|nr:unnamed protein product [Spirodela intermedia]